MKIIPEVDVYVRFCETDAGGHVSNTSYFMYFEEARTKFFSEIGYGLNERKLIHFIVARTECDFIAQAYAGQTLSVQTGVSKIGRKSYTMVHEIKVAETGEVIAKGSAVIVCFNFQEQHSVTIPVDLRKLFEKYLMTSSA